MDKEIFVVYVEIMTISGENVTSLDSVCAKDSVEARNLVINSLTQAMSSKDNIPIYIGKVVISSEVIAAIKAEVLCVIDKKHPFNDVYVDQATAFDKLLSGDSEELTLKEI